MVGLPQNPDLTNTYKTIARHITSVKGQCVLVLGPELSVDKTGLNYRDAFRGMLPSGSGSEYHTPVNLFSFHDEMDEGTVTEKVIKFYSESGDRPLLDMIARIKFPLIINVCPDKALNTVYDQNHFPYERGYFTKDSKFEFERLPIPTKELPVIYNIFGSIDVDTSLILTHRKLYETIEYLLPEKSLPENLEYFLRQIANSYVFLGFKFDSWYYQLICHKLRIRTSDSKKTCLSTPFFGEKENVSIIMNNSFDMKFAIENPFECIQKIIQVCETERSGDLRKKSDSGHFSVFVSYGRKDDQDPAREDIVDRIERDFTPSPTELYQLFRDRQELKFGDSIDSFMTRIGQGKSVIMVITDKYLRSVYCMKEALRIYRSEDKEKRIFHILLQKPGENILGDTKPYKDHWFQEIQDRAKDPGQLEDASFEEYRAIYAFIDRFMRLINPIVHLDLRYPDIVKDAAGDISLVPGKQQEYADFIDTVKAKLKTP